MQQEVGHQEKNQMESNASVEFEQDSTDQCDGYARDTFVQELPLLYALKIMQLLLQS